LFLCWAIALSAVWVFVNLPRDGGSLKPFMEWAGFPWTFAFWEFGRLEWFNPAALAGNIALGVAVILSLARLCSLSRRGARDPASHP
jgi:hypothetical protein